MKVFELKADLRKPDGKKETKKLRKTEKVPCVLYGGKENVHFSVPYSSLNKLIYTDKVYKVKIDVDNNSHIAIIQDIQFHPVSDKILHIDFLNVSNEKPVVMDIPIKLEGFPIGVKQGGKLFQMVRKLKTKALIDNMLDIIPINVEKISLGKSITVGNLNFENLEFIDPPKRVVATVKAARATAAVGIEEEEGEASAEATPAEPAAE